jgi:putative membrane protein
MTEFLWSVLAGPVAVLLGILTGTVTGLIPGLHVNLVVFMIVSAFGSLAIDPVLLSMYIVSTAVTQSYLDFVPAIFLGVPTSESAVAVFPGHRLLLKGKGPEAFAAAQAGGITASILVTIFVCSMLMFPDLLQELERAIRPILGYLLSGFLVYFVVREIPRAGSSSVVATSLRVLAVLISLMALAQLSTVALSGVLVPSDTGIMAAFSGLFGFSVLIVSLLNRDGPGRMVEQTQHSIQWSRIAKFGWKGMKGTLGGLVVGFLPGLGVGEVSAMVASRPKDYQKEDVESSDLAYIATVGAVGTADALVSIVAVFLIGKSRSGASVGVEKLLSDHLSHGATLTSVFLTLVCTGLVAGFTSLYLGQSIANRAGRTLSKVRYSDLTGAILIAITIFTVFSGGLYGFLLLVASSLIGIFVLTLRIRPTTMMAFLIIPAAAFFLGTEIPGLPLFPLPEAHLWPRPAISALGTGIVIGCVAGWAWYWGKGARAS